MDNVYDYRSTPIALPVRSNLAVSLEVVDLRPYVQNGKKEANFVGLRRGGYGNPFNVKTASGAPLTDDFLFAINTALENAGFRIEEAPDIDRQLTLTVREWKSDVFSNLKIIYDVDLEVMDSDGSLLGKATITGEEPAGGGAVMKQHNDAVRRTFEAKMSKLFFDPSVNAALTDEPLRKR